MYILFMKNDICAMVTRPRNTKNENKGDRFFFRQSTNCVSAGPSYGFFLRLWPISLVESGY